MTNVLNALPISVHQASGGDARVRVGGSAIVLNEISSGSFTVTGATRFRLVVNLRTMSPLLVLIGYGAPVTLANASMICQDTDTVVDDVPEGTVVHFTLLDGMDLQPAPASTSDYLYVSLYG